MNATATEIEQRVVAVRARIARACEQCGRNPRDVTLIGATKTMTAGTIAHALNAGLRDIGENQVQEAKAKRDALATASSLGVWHLIGHLQTNKVRDALAVFDVIH